MKTKSILILFTSMSLFAVLIIAGSCGSNSGGGDQSVAKPIDPKQLEKAGQLLCPTGTSFKIDNQEYGIFQHSFPQPVLFGIQKGVHRCALVNTIDEGGITTWLKISFSNNCLENGSLWMIDTFTNIDGGKVYLDLKRWDITDLTWVKIFTSYGRSMNYIREKMGLLVYSCQ